MTTFLIILFLFFLLVLILYFSDIRFEIKEASTTKLNKLEKYDITLYLYFIGIKYFKLTVNEKNKKNSWKGKLINKIIKNSRKKKGKERLNNGLEIIKLFNIESIDLKVKIGLENVILSSFATATISSLIGIILANKVKKYDKDKIKFEVTPYYMNKNFINVNLNCIIVTKIAHIIHRLIKRKKRSEQKNGRTSYRKFNVNSYG